jgi:hypothetical protein
MRHSLRNLFGFVKKTGRRVSMRSSRRLLIEHLEDRTLLSTFFVALSGSDATPDGTNPATPFRSVQAAINAAASTSDGADVVKVASGTYNDGTFDLNLTVPNSPNLQNLQLLGGWDPTFTTQAPGTTIYIPQTPGATGLYDLEVDNPSTTVDGFYFVCDGTQGVGGTQRAAVSSPMRPVWRSATTPSKSARPPAVRAPPACKPAVAR